MVEIDEYNLRRRVLFELGGVFVEVGGQGQ